MLLHVASRSRVWGALLLVGWLLAG
ncbi:MAG: hypothetical protein RLZZ501_1180, partial [Pseudomonadota bacterium]